MAPSSVRSEDFVSDSSRVMQSTDGKSATNFKCYFCNYFIYSCSSDLVALRVLVKSVMEGMEHVSCESCWWRDLTSSSRFDLVSVKSWASSLSAVLRLINFS